jgi:lysophospholipid acyltransferase (LPLAT)-like uncharacterized protein
MLKPLLRRPEVQALLAAALGRYLALALRTTRWTLHGAEHVAPHIAGQPAIIAFWHERLPLMPALWRQARRAGAVVRTHVLVSRHSDGRLVGDLMRGLGLHIVHGSTARDGRDRGGAAGLRMLLDRLAAGEHVAITPDGPRGPRRQPAPGVAQLAALSGVPVVPCAAQTSRRRVLGTWDRMVLPLPFGRGVIVCGPTIVVGRQDAAAALPAIAAALTAAADQADRLCP